MLDFDHLRDKRASLSLMVRNGWSIQSIAAEIEKCEVVCANCHRRRSAARQGGWFKVLMMTTR